MQPVVLASYPRAGVTFLRHVLETLYDLPTFSAYAGERSDVIGSPTSSLVWESDHARFGAFPIGFIKVHMMPPTEYSKGWYIGDTPVVHLIRDGRDCIVSHAHFLQDYAQDGRTLRENMEELIRGDREKTDIPYWAPHTLAWLARSAYRVFFDALIADPVAVASKLMGALAPDVAMNGKRPKSFAELHQGAPQFFRRGKVGGWRDEMPDDLHRLFWEFNGDAMRAVEELKHGSADK
jgi:hypothetical protein